MIIRKIFFIINNQKNLIKKKNNLPLAPKSFIFGNLNKNIKDLLLIYQEYNIKKYKAIIFYFTWLYCIIDNFINFLTAYFLKIFIVMGHIILSTYLI